MRKVLARPALRAVDARAWKVFLDQRSERARCRWPDGVQR
jgi:hypothetical protein